MARSCLLLLALAATAADAADKPKQEHFAAGGDKSCALDPRGHVVCFGDWTKKDGALEVAGLGRAVDLAVADQHGCAVLASGKVFCFGDPSHGRLGDGRTGNGETDCGVDHPGWVAGLEDAVQVSLGRDHGCALRKDGEVACWGENLWGQVDGLAPKVGPEDEVPFYEKPVRVPGLTGVLQIAAGEQHSCALLTSGQVSCWGSSLYGATGQGRERAEAQPPRPVRNLSDAVEVVAGRTFACARVRTGTVACWGDNSTGQLGVGQASGRDGGPAPIEKLEATALAAGGGHACAVLKTGGVSCWGFNHAGQVGPSMDTIVLEPQPLPDLGNAALVWAGKRHSCAELRNGRRTCWGDNRLGQFGRTDWEQSALPVPAELPKVLGPLPEEARETPQSEEDKARCLSELQKAEAARAAPAPLVVGVKNKPEDEGETKKPRRCRIASEPEPGGRLRIEGADFRDGIEVQWGELELPILQRAPTVMTVLLPNNGIGEVRISGARRREDCGRLEFP